MTVFSRIIPIIIILVLISSSISFIYETGNDPGIRVNPESYIPYNSVALAFVKSPNFNMFIFHTNNESAVIFQEVSQDPGFSQDHQNSRKVLKYLE